MKRSFTFLAFFAFLFAMQVNAQIPQTINWQGIIQDANGNNLNGEHSVSVSLFDVATDGVALWTEIHNTVAITDGFANIVLGSVAPLNLPFDKQYWLEITVDNGTPMPRIQLASVPYALNMRNYTRVYDDGASESYFEEQDEEGNFKNVLIRKDKNGNQRKNVVKKERFGDGEKREVEEFEKVYDEDGSLLTSAIELRDEREDTSIESIFRRWFGESGSSFEESSRRFVNVIGGRATMDEFTERALSRNSRETRTETSTLREDEILSQDEIEKILFGRPIERRTETSTLTEDEILYDIDRIIFGNSGETRTERRETERSTDDENYREEVTTTYDEEGNTETEITHRDDYQTGSSSTTVSDGEGNTCFYTIDPISGLVVQLGDAMEGYPLSIGGPPDGYIGDGYRIEYQSEYSNNPNITLTHDGTASSVAVGGEYFVVTSETGVAINDFDIYGNSSVDGNMKVGDTLNVGGNATVQGDLNVNGTKNFRIDHPDDPENKYLQHACIESDEVLNQYTGNVVTNSEGIAVVTLADYVQKINIDFRYQLTVIGDFAQAIIAKEVENNQFTIKTDKPNIKVSWMIIAKRNDKYMQEHPFEPVVLKNKEELNRINNIFNKEKLDPNSDPRNKRINRNEK